MKLIANICRFLVGVTFIFSGLVKAVDTLGFAYKLDEYWDVFHTTFMSPLSLPLAMLMCLLEISLGVALLLGFRMKLTSWLLLLLMIFFTFLTGFAAITGTPKECGCFGDAIKLSSWQTFWKDIALDVLVLIIFVSRNHIKPLFAQSFNNLLMALGVLSVIAFIYYNYAHLPIWDFRPYKVGNNLMVMRHLPAGAKPSVYQTTFIYKNLKTGEDKKFTEKDYPWADTLNWKYVDTKNELVQEGDQPQITDLFIYDDNNRDITDSLLTIPDFTLWVVMYDLKGTNKNAFDKINELVKSLDAHHVKVLGLTSSEYEDADNFRHSVSAAFPFYRADNTVLKTMIRANPGLMLMKAGTVMGHWHYNDTPTWEELAKEFGLK